MRFTLLTIAFGALALAAPAQLSQRDNIGTGDPAAGLGDIGGSSGFGPPIKRWFDYAKSQIGYDVRCADWVTGPDDAQGQCKDTCPRWVKWMPGRDCTAMNGMVTKEMVEGKPEEE